MKVNVISFPKLNMEFVIDRVAFSVFGKPIYWYGIIIALGFILGVAYGLKNAKKHGISSDTILDVVLWGLPTCIICARLFYVLGDMSVLDGGFWKIFAIWEGGIAIYGAIIGAIIVGLTYSRIKKINTGLLFDVCAPSIMIGQIIGRFGNFVNAEVYGGVTDSVFGMSINGAECVQPLFLYEALWMLLGLCILVIYQKNKRVNGEIFLSYIIWYSTGRFFLEMLRDEEYVLKIFTMPLSQIVSMICVVTGVVLLVRLYIKAGRNARKKDNCQMGTGENDENIARDENEGEQNMSGYEQLEQQRRELQKELHLMRENGATDAQILEQSQKLDKIFTELQKSIAND